MPGRVNTKFVLILVTSITAVAVVLLGIYWFQFRNNPSVLARKGDVYMQSGDYERAVESYRRAAARSQSDPFYWDKLEKALYIAPTDFQTNAERYFRLLLTAARQKSDIASDDPDAQREYYQLLCDLGEELNYNWMYQQLYTDANTRLDTQPDFAVARKYRGISHVHMLTDRGDQYDSARGDMEQAQQDLVAALDRWPDDTDALYYLAQWLLFDGRYQRHINSPLKEIQSNRAQALSLSQRMLAIDEDKPDLMIKHARVCLVVADDIERDPSPDTAQAQALRDEAAKLVSGVEKTLLEGDLEQEGAMQLVLDVAVLLQMTDDEMMSTPDGGAMTTRGRYRALQLYNHALDKHPDTVDYLVQQGSLLMSMGKTDEALAAFEQARRPGRSMPAIAFLRTQNQQILAAVQIGNLLITRLANNPNSADKQQLTDRIEGLIAELEPVYGRIPALDLLEGKLKLTQGELAASLQLFDKASRATEGTNFEADRLAASVARQLGEQGDAARRLERILATNPAHLQSRLELTEIYMTGGELDKAQAQLDILTAEYPDNTVVQMLQANMLAANGDVDKAIAIYESQDPSANANIDVILSRLYLLADRPEDARALIERRYEQDPKNMQTLTMLLRLVDDPDEQQVYLDKAIEAGVDPGMVSVVKRQLSTDPITPDELDVLLPQIDSDPFRLAMSQARRLILSGDLDAAEAKLAEAATLNPDDKVLLEMRFSLSLQREDWVQAERLADRAKQMNLDLAGGAFYRGQLADARGRLDEAISEFESALQQRPIFSNGWRLLGDSYAKLNRTQQAIEAYRRSIEQQPNDVNTLDHLSRAEMQAQEYTLALRHAREAWQFQPNNSQLMERYIELERTHGDPATAMKLRQQLAESQPNNSDNQRSLIRLMHNEGKQNEAGVMLEELIKSEGLTRPNAAIKADLLFEEDRARDGERVLKDYLASRGDEAESLDYAMLAQYRIRLGDLPGAVEAFQAARRLDDTPNMLFTRMLGDQLFLYGAYDKAAPLYKEVLEQSPQDMGVRLRLAETLFRMNELEETKQLLQGTEPETANERSTVFVLRSIIALPPDKDPQAPENRDALVESLRLVNLAIQQDGNNAMAFTRRAALLLNDPQRSGSAINDLNRALELQPNMAEARRLLAEAHLKRGDNNEAARELRRLVELQPENRQWRLMLINLYQNTNDRTSAQALTDDAIKLQPDDPLWAGIRAQQAQAAGDNAEAIKQFKRQVELRTDAGTVSQYTLALLNNKQADDALKVLEKHAALVNEDLSLQAIRARALALAGSVSQAEQVFINTLSRASNMNEVAAIVSQMAMAMSPQQATAVLRRMDNAQDAMWLRVSEAFLLSRNRQYEEAISTLEPLRDRLPSDPSTQTFYLRELAQAYHLGGQYEKARGAYEDLLILTPDDAGTLNNVAYLLIEELDKPAEGLKMAERAVEAMPDNGGVMDTLGWAQYKLGQLDEARRTLERSVNREPLAPSCLHLSHVYIDLGLTSRAREQLMRAIELADETQDSATRAEAERLLDRLNAPSAP